jgi:hypothetical protein
LRYCIGQENSGRIVGAVAWTDRKWMQLVYVTRREVGAKSELWRWEGADLVVSFYPIEKQREVEAKRSAGRSTVAKRWGEQGSSAINSATRSADTEVGSWNKEVGIGEEKAATLPKDDASGSAQTPPAADAAQLVSSAEAGESPETAKPTPKPPAKRVLSDSDWLAEIGLDPAFAGIDILREHSKCARWCKENAKQLSRRRFINWLNRCDKPLNGGKTSEFEGRF